MTGNMTADSNGATWEEVFYQALGDAEYGHRGRSPTKEEFVGTFRAFYEDYVYETRITRWPGDPEDCHRAAESRATVYWADEYSDKAGDGQ